MATPVDLPDARLAPVSIQVQPGAASIHPEPQPSELHAEPEPRREVGLSESTGETPRNAPEIPRVSLELPPESGLVLVETSHAAAPGPDEPETMRPRRVRPPRVEISEEPLQIVETTHKDSTPPA
jgi:hypothetical protein